MLRLPLNKGWPSRKVADAAKPLLDRGVLATQSHSDPIKVVNVEVDARADPNHVVRVPMSKGKRKVSSITEPPNKKNKAEPPSSLDSALHSYMLQSRLAKLNALGAALCGAGRYHGPMPDILARRIACFLDAPPKPPLVFRPDEYHRLEVKKNGVEICSSSGLKQPPGWFTAGPPFSTVNGHWQVQLMADFTCFQLGIQFEDQQQAVVVAGAQPVKGHRFTWEPGTGNLLVDNSIVAEAALPRCPLRQGAILGLYLSSLRPNAGVLSLELDHRWLGRAFIHLPSGVSLEPLFCFHDRPQKAPNQGLRLL